MQLTKNNIVHEMPLRNCNTEESSYSPFFSDIGLGFGTSGINEVWLHYNRATRLLFNRLIETEAKITLERSNINLVCFDCGKLAFYGHNAFVFEQNTDKEAGVFRGDVCDKVRYWPVVRKKNMLVFRSFASRGDDRDPDSEFPVIYGINVTAGTLMEEDGKYSVKPENGKIAFAMAFRILDCDESALEDKLLSAPSVSEAAEKCGSWLENVFSQLNLKCANSNEKDIAVNALRTLAFNLKEAPGNLRNFVSQFPNRGAYPTHFLWDTCFHILAFLEFNPALAKESLLIMAKNQRSDGKFSQFLCSTWQRPEFSQPPLVGWSAKNITGRTGDLEFAQTMLESIEKNNNWWLNSRITPCGLISCPHGLETGQDDSPRFDNGATVSCDMNGFLLSQMRCAAYLAEKLGQTERAAKLNSDADRFAQRIVDVLYDRDNHIFFDVDNVTGKRVSIISPSSFIPVWAGVPLSPEETETTVKKYLLNEKYLFGNIPFPSVAYTEPEYKPDAWWRGPTWLPIAWIMLETLEKFGFDKEYKVAKERLFNMITLDGKLSELFNSESGEGLGSVEQGWSAAIYIKMLADKSKE